MIHTYTNYFVGFAVDLKFKLNWASYILSGNPIFWAFGSFRVLEHGKEERKEKNVFCVAEHLILSNSLLIDSQGSALLPWEWQELIWGPSHWGPWIRSGSSAGDHTVLSSQTQGMYFCVTFPGFPQLLLLAADPPASPLNKQMSKVIWKPVSPLVDT